MGYIRDYQFFAFPLLAFVVLAGLLYATEFRRRTG